MKTFEPDQLVLVRECDTADWELARYSHCRADESNGHIHHEQGRRWFTDNDILPYTGNEHLLGTTNSPTPTWEPIPGDLVAVRNVEGEEWKARVFRYRDIGTFACDNENIRTGICFWQECEPLRKHFLVSEE